jgi:predicted RNase H-like HicB family nuclease
MKRAFNVIIEPDEDGYFVATVPELPGCHTQAKSLDELNQRIEEAITFYHEHRKQAKIVGLFGTIPYAADYNPKKPRARCPLSRTVLTRVR